MLANLLVLTGAMMVGGGFTIAGLVVADRYHRKKDQETLTRILNDQKWKFPIDVIVMVAEGQETWEEKITVVGAFPSHAMAVEWGIANIGSEMIWFATQTGPVWTQMK